MAKILYVSNNSGSDVTLEDLGGYVIANGVTNLDLTTVGFREREIRDSQDLAAALGAATPILTAIDENSDPVTDPEELVGDFQHHIGENVNVTETSPTTGEVLEYQASGIWENKTKAEADIASAATLSSHTGNTSNPHTVTLEQARTAGNTVAGDINMDGNEVIGLPTIPSGDTAAVSKAYVDGLVEGLDWKHSVRAIEATTDLDLSGLETVDGVSLQDGDRVLLIAQGSDEATPLDADVENGIWIVRTGAWERPDDFDTGMRCANNAVFVEEGVSYGDTAWVCTTDAGGATPTDVIDSDPNQWTQFSGASDVVAGAGLTKAGNTLNVGDANKGVQVNADDVEIDASESAGPGIQAGDVGLSGDSWKFEVKPDTQTADASYANAISVGTNGVKISVDNSTIEGSGQGAVGAESLRVKDGGITEAKLDVLNAPTADYVLAYDGTGQMKWTPNYAIPTGAEGTEPSTPSDGALWYNTTKDMLMKWDSGRGKWLSVTMEWLGAARNASTTKDQYLRVYDSQSNNLGGWRMPWDATIVAVAVQTNSASTWDLEVRRNDVVTPVLLTYSMTATTGQHNKTINVDVDEGDFVQLYCASTGGADNPTVRVWYRWHYVPA